MVRGGRTAKPYSLLGTPATWGGKDTVGSSLEKERPQYPASPVGEVSWVGTPGVICTALPLGTLFASTHWAKTWAPTTPGSVAVTVTWNGVPGAWTWVVVPSSMVSSTSCAYAVDSEREQARTGRMLRRMDSPWLGSDPLVASAFRDGAQPCAARGIATRTPIAFARRCQAGSFLGHGSVLQHSPYRGVDLPLSTALRPSTGASARVPRLPSGHAARR